MHSLLSLHIFAHYPNLTVEGEMTQLSVSFSSYIPRDKPRKLSNRTNKHGRRDHLLLRSQPFFYVFTDRGRRESL